MRKQNIVKSGREEQTALQVDFDDLPNNAFVREAELIRTGSNPLGPIPFSAHTLWRKVRDGSFPRPLKLSSRVTAWRVSDVRDWMHACFA